MEGFVDVDAIARGIRDEAEAGARLTGSWNPLLSQSQLDWLLEEQLKLLEEAKAAVGTE